MAIYFLDSSAVAKQYVQEVGSKWVMDLLDPSTGNAIFVARITGVEVISAIARRRRGGTISATQATAALTQFRTDFARLFQAVEMTKSLLDAAMVLAEQYSLRGYDAAQMAAAIEVAQSVSLAGMVLTLVSADAELNSAAAAHGLQVEDPNQHP